MMLRLINSVILISFFMLSACGYHLRGSQGLPDQLKKVYLQGASSQLKKNARKSLRSSDGKLVSHAGDSELVIDIVKEKMDRRVISLTPAGRASEYEITYTLDYRFSDAAGKHEQDVQHIEIIKDYFNDQEDVLARNKEEKVIVGEIYQQAMRTIIDRARIRLDHQ